MLLGKKSQITGEKCIKDIIGLEKELEAGWFIGKASCYAVEVLADNATFLLAVNRMVAFCAQDFKPTTHSQLSSSTVALLV